mmetsp:Transcript_137904/g.344258  ORF Transcript_137904/g.344258 Transcript_137904/m.344258 type:complete len:219 (+) Transcript_137904:1221-1877(+)
MAAGTTSGSKSGTGSTSFSRCSSFLFSSCCSSSGLTSSTSVTTSAWGGSGLMSRGATTGLGGFSGSTRDILTRMPKPSRLPKPAQTMACVTPDNWSCSLHKSAASSPTLSRISLFSSGRPGQWPSSNTVHVDGKALSASTAFWRSSKPSRASAIPESCCSNKSRPYSRATSLITLRLRSADAIPTPPPLLHAFIAAPPAVISPLPKTRQPSNCRNNRR